MFPLRFSLFHLVIAISLLAALFAYFERRTRQHVLQARHATHLVDADEAEVARQMHAWLSGLGFHRVSDPPESVQGVDLFGDPYQNFYRGSFKGSRPFYVSLHPNWDPVDRPNFNKTNILIYVVIEFIGRRWQEKCETELQEEFMMAFHERAAGIARVQE